MTENEKLLKKLSAEKDFKPNDAQYRAITHIEGPLFLTAGPGSGKTRVLLWRTLNLIVFHNVQPNEIFLATFTEKAALQLKEGLQGLLSIASKYTDYFIETAPPILNRAPPVSVKAPVKSL